MVEQHVKDRQYRDFRALHWAMVIIFIVLAMVTEYALDYVTDSEQRFMVRNLHVSIGVIFALFLLFRWYWYVRNHTVRATFSSTWQRRLAFSNFIILHALMTLLVLSGFTRLLSDGDDVSFFNLSSTISLSEFENRGVKYYAQEAHLYLRNATYVFVFLHLLGAFDFYFRRRRKLDKEGTKVSS